MPNARGPKPPLNEEVARAGYAAGIVVVGLMVLGGIVALVGAVIAGNGAVIAGLAGAGLVAVLYAAGVVEDANGRDAKKPGEVRRR
jgi:hypothetical protein